MIARLSHIFQMACRPGYRLADRLERSGIAPPSENFISRHSLPVFMADNLLKPFHNDHWPRRSKFKETVERVSRGVERLSLQQIEGCIASKSGITRFADMQGLASVGHHVNAYAGDADTLAARVLAGSFDCVARAGENPAVYQTDWSDRRWFANAGGSHRTAAVHEIDRRNGHDRMPDCDITAFRVRDDFKEFCRDHAIFVFKPEDFIPLTEDMMSDRKAGIDIAPEAEGRFEDRNWCMVIAKTHPDFALLSAKMTAAVDVSAWYLAPAAFDAAYDAKTSRSAETHPANAIR